MWAVSIEAEKARASGSGIPMPDDASAIVHEPQLTDIGTPIYISEISNVIQSSGFVGVFLILPVCGEVRAFS